MDASDTARGDGADVAEEPKAQPEASRSSPSPRRGTWVALALGAVALVVLPAGLALQSCLPAHGAAKAFTAALRSGHPDEARALATADLRTRIDGAAGDSDTARTLALLRTTDGDTFYGASGGFDAWCFSGSMTFAAGGSRDFYIVVRDEAGQWRVTNVDSSHVPDECDGDASDAVR